MQFTIEPGESGLYIVTTVQGKVTRETAVQFITAGFDAGNRLGIGCHLVDLTRARNADQVVGMVHLQRDDVPDLESRYSNVCVALLVDPTDRSHDFYVAFAQSMGTRIDLFWDRRKAIAYLEKAAPRFNTGASG